MKKSTPTLTEFLAYSFIASLLGLFGGSAKAEVLSPQKAFGSKFVDAFSAVSKIPLASFAGEMSFIDDPVWDDLRGVSRKIQNKFGMARDRQDGGAKVFVTTYPGLPKSGDRVALFFGQLQFDL